MEHNGMPADTIEAQLDKILGSRTFSKADRASRFLRFVVQQYLQGKSNELKEYVIGVEVLGRKPDFDPRVDTIVRAEAQRLRTRLDEYYASSGAHDNIKISIPKGTYVPRFDLNGAPPKDAPGRGPMRSSQRYLLWLASAGALIVMATVLPWWFRASSVPKDVPVPTPLTSYRGSLNSPSFSPDGNQVAFAWRPSEQSHSNIYAKLLGVNEPSRLTRDSMGDYGPAWSPDGKSIAFLRTLSHEKDGVFLVPAIGGPVRKLAEIYASDLSECQQWQPAWQTRGGWLAVMDKDAADGPFKLFLVSTETGEKRRLTSPPPAFMGDQYPAFSPDGRTIAFVRSSFDRVSDLYLLELSDELRPQAEPKRVTFENSLFGYLTWTPDGHAIVFSSYGGLWRIELRPRVTKPERLVFSEGGSNPAFSRTGRLAYTHSVLDIDIWRLDLARRARGSAKRLISSTRADYTPQYSPDGKRIAFGSDRSGSPEIWVSDSEGLNAVQLTTFGGFRDRISPRWSSDGRWIYFTSVQDSGPECWVISSDGGRPSRVTTDGMNICAGDRSRDGRWLYFERDGQVWKVPTGKGSPVQVTFKGGHRPMESPDGRFLYYAKEAGGDFSTLWRVPLPAGKETQVLESVYIDNVALTNQGIYFIPTPEHPSVQFLNFATGKIELISSFADRPSSGFSISADGRWLLYSSYNSILMHDLMLVENFR
jgi:Tol biopolymer transport system component